MTPRPPQPHRTTAILPVSIARMGYVKETLCPPRPSDPATDNGNRWRATASRDVAALSTRLTHEYGLRHPFVGAGMGFIAHELGLLLQSPERRRSCAGSIAKGGEREARRARGTRREGEGGEGGGGKEGEWKEALGAR